MESWLMDAVEGVNDRASWIVDAGDKGDVVAQEMVVCKWAEIRANYRFDPVFYWWLAGWLDPMLIRRWEINYQVSYEGHSGNAFVEHLFCYQFPLYLIALKWMQITEVELPKVLSGEVTKSEFHNNLSNAGTELVRHPDTLFLLAQLNLSPGAARNALFESMQGATNSYTNVTSGKGWMRKRRLSAYFQGDIEQGVRDELPGRLYQLMISGPVWDTLQGWSFSVLNAIERDCPTIRAAVEEFHDKVILESDFTVGAGTREAIALEQLANGGDFVFAEVEQREKTALLRRLIEDAPLSPQQRKIMLLVVEHPDLMCLADDSHDQSGRSFFPYGEVATLLGLPVQQVYEQFSQAKKRLKAFVKDYPERVIE